MTARASPFYEEVMSTETDETAHEIEELEHRLAATWTSSDCVGWGALIAPEWSVTHINGAVMTREQALTMCRSSQVRIADMRYDDLATTASGNLARFCWNSMFWSAVRRTSKLIAACRSRAPFDRLVHPSATTLETVWSLSNAPSGRGSDSSSRMRTRR